tara:strand:- start:919 stop:1101 length:183 start_codon:yes stop_codon:yes gene_type:complete
MTAVKTLVLRCDKPACGEKVHARPDEDVTALRRRAAAERGWRSTPSFDQGGHSDRCRFHA